MGYCRATAVQRGVGRVYGPGENGWPARHAKPNRESVRRAALAAVCFPVQLGRANEVAGINQPMMSAHVCRRRYQFHGPGNADERVHPSSGSQSTAGGNQVPTRPHV